jgi:hypothetical protein
VIDLRGSPGKFGELFRIKKRFVNPLRACVQIDFLMDHDRLVILRRNKTGKNQRK